jgi:signal transduction histidine kinase
VSDRDESPQDPVALREELERLRAALQAAEARSEHAERLASMGRLLAGVVHELNNPLTAVIMYAASLRGSEPAEQEKIAAILEASGRLQRLSRELIGFVRPAATGEPLDLAELVHDALQLVRPELKASGAAVERQGGTATILGSRQSLVQVAVALLSNAARATGRGGHIRVSVAQRDGEATLVVADDGAGMSDEVQGRAFEVFFTTRPGESLGLGLSTARAIVERHRGRVTLESALGRGTTVTVVLPAR